MSKQGHPLPDSGEARHNEIPEHLARDKGRGDDERTVVQPRDEAVTPDGEPYAYDDLGRGPEESAREGEMPPLQRGDSVEESPDRVGGDKEEFARDQQQHQDRGQKAAEAESDTG